MMERWRIHPSLRGRSEPLGSGDPPTCDFEKAEDGHPAGGTRYVCPSCQVPWVVYGPGKPPGDRLCPQMKKTGGPAPVSNRKAEKRKKRGIYGPLCGFVLGRVCCVPGCGASSDPAHVRSVGSGRGDWMWDDEFGRWRGNVANLCRAHHDEYDGKVGGGSGSAFEERYEVDVALRADGLGWRFAEEYGVDLSRRGVHPYRQMGWAA